MYSDKPEKKTGWVRLALLLVIVAIAAGLVLSAASGRKMLASGTDAVREAVEQSARQCYAVEGVYPPDLKYLQENYGLQVNTRDYVISYEIYASNIAPTVKVVLK